jgi:hypothetical protein
MVAIDKCPYAGRKVFGDIKSSRGRLTWLETTDFWEIDKLGDGLTFFWFYEENIPFTNIAMKPPGFKEIPVTYTPS